MKNVLANARYWTAGVLVAAAGVLCVRLVAPTFTGTTRVGLTLAGELVACVGLLIICIGVSRRIKRGSAPDAS